MSVPASYLGVILIWSTTPLAIQWSGDSVGYLFGITSRMVLGLIVGLLLLLPLRVRMPRDQAALLTYLSAGLGLFFAMLSVYYASRFIPSGWISVLFGLAPMITGLLAHFVLGEQALTRTRVLGILLGLAGLASMLLTAQSLGPHALAGILGMLVSVCAYSLSAIAVKRINAVVPPLATTIGSLAVTVPLLLMVYMVSDSGLPTTVPVRSAMAILYLGVIGSVLGFALYYHVLQHMETTRVALLTLITPVLALLLGHVFNNEPVSLRTWTGTATILGGLLLFEFGDRIIARRLPVSGDSGANPLP